MDVLKPLYVLERFAHTTDGTIGRMGPWYCMEEEDQGNRTDVSCIPAGTYVCKRTWYNGGGYETFEITEVDGRSHILFHRANTEEDLAGCVGLGSAVGFLRVEDEDSGEPTRKLAVLGSGLAFLQFMQSLEGVQHFTLRVVDPR